MLLAVAFVQLVNAQNARKLVMQNTTSVKVVVTSTQGAPRQGEEVLLIDQSNALSFTGKTGPGGTFTVRLPVGSTYTIRLKTLADTSRYASFAIPEL